MPTFSGAGPSHILQTMRPERWSAPVLGSLTNVQDAQVHMCYVAAAAAVLGSPCLLAAINYIPHQVKQVQRRSALAHILCKLHPYRKKTPGGAGTHTGHTGPTDTRITQGQSEPHLWCTLNLKVIAQSPNRLLNNLNGLMEIFLQQAHRPQLVSDTTAAPHRSSSVQFTHGGSSPTSNFSCVQAQRGSPSLSEFVVGFVIGFIGQWIPSPSGASSSHTGRPHSTGRRPKTCLTLAAGPTS